MTYYLPSKSGQHCDVTQIITLESVVPTILHRTDSAPHAGHPGKNGTLLQARLLYYWPRMRIDIINYIDNYKSCAEYHGSVSKPVPVQSYLIPNELWETIVIGLLQLPLTTEGNGYRLVANDHLSRFSILVPLKDKSATTEVRAFTDEVFCQFTTLKFILSGNGTEINNQVLEAISKEFQVNKANIAAYHPGSNGLVERQNRKITQHLRTLVGDVSTSWREWMPQVLASLNSSLHNTIGDTPHFVVWGQDKRLPYIVLLKKEDPLYNLDNDCRLRMTDFLKIYK